MTIKDIGDRIALSPTFRHQYPLPTSVLLGSIALKKKTLILMNSKMYKYISYLQIEWFQCLSADLS